jgi:hypothetical protein
VVLLTAVDSQTQSDPIVIIKKTVLCMLIDLVSLVWELYKLPVKWTVSSFRFVVGKFKWKLSSVKDPSLDLKTSGITCSLLNTCGLKFVICLIV